MTKKEKFLKIGKAKKKPEPEYVIRDSKLLAYNPEVDKHRIEPFYKQLLPLFVALMENFDALTIAEIIVLFRGGKDKTKPDKREIWRVKDWVYQFRKWLGPAALVIYSKSKPVDGLEKYGNQKIYEPFHTLQEYKRSVVYKHLEKVGNAVLNKHKENIATLVMPWSEIQKTIAAKMMELETGLPYKPKSKPKRKKGKK